MAGSNRSSNGSEPKRSHVVRQPETAPGTVTLSQPVKGMALWRANDSGVQARGARPEALRPCSVSPSQISAKASPPMPFMHGSTTVSAMAVASAASTALPPRASMRRPAAAANGCDVAITLSASTGKRRAVYGKSQKAVMNGSDKFEKMGGASQAGDESGRRPGRVAELR
ncbi:hypothetical protein D3C86_1265710 [compost metagenome]